MEFIDSLLYDGVEAAILRAHKFVHESYRQKLAYLVKHEKQARCCSRQEGYYSTDGMRVWPEHGQGGNVHGGVKKLSPRERVATDMIEQEVWLLSKARIRTHSFDFTQKVSVPN